MTKGCSTVHKHSGTCSNRQGSRISKKKTETPEDSEDSELESRIWPHYVRISPDNADHMEKAFSIIRKTYDRKPTDDLKDLDVNTVYGGIFMCVTLQAAVHLGQDYSQNLRSIKYQPLKSVKQLFRTTEKLIKDQVEITGLSTSDWNQRMWRESSLLCDRAAVHIMKFKTHVFADSVRCLGGISTVPVQAWKDKIKWYLATRYLKDLDRIDGEPMEFEYNNFPGFITLGILDEIQKMMAELRCEPEQFQGRIIFMSMYNDIKWGAPGNGENCMAISMNVAAYANKFPQGCWSFLGPGSEKKRNSCQ